MTEVSTLIQPERLRLALVDAIEQFFYLRSETPSFSELKAYSGSPRWLTEQFWDESFDLETFQNSLAARGINYAPREDSVSLMLPPVGVLTGVQLAAVNLILDGLDKRSIKEKLKSLGVSTQLYNSWLKQKAFSEFFQARADKLFGDTLPEVHVALKNRATTGDVSAIKLVYEVTGYHTDRPDKEFNPLWIISQVMDILQRKVDPSTLALVAEELVVLVNSIQGNSKRIEKPLEIASRSIESGL